VLGANNVQPVCPVQRAGVIANEVCCRRHWRSTMNVGVKILGVTKDGPDEFCVARTGASGDEKRT